MGAALARSTQAAGDSDRPYLGPGFGGTSVGSVINAVGGTGVAWRQTNRTGAFRSNRPPFISTPVAETLSNAVFAASGGLDGAIALHQRLAILALVRVHLLHDKDRLPDGVVRRGVSSVIVRYGVGAQVRF